MRASIRRIQTSDAEILATLHITSWRSAYRGILRDAYLDVDVVDERHAVWRERMDNLTSSQFGFVAEMGTQPVGFVFLYGQDHPRWGTLIDNLPTYVYVRDRESRHMLSNRAQLNALKARTLEETLGKTDFDFFPPELARSYYDDDQEVMRTGRPASNKADSSGGIRGFSGAEPGRPSTIRSNTRP